jgi:hypothetical protein
MAEIKSESVADFIPESVAGLLRNQHPVRLSFFRPVIFGWRPSAVDLRYAPAGMGGRAVEGTGLEKRGRPLRPAPRCTVMSEISRRKTVPEVAFMPYNSVRFRAIGWQFRWHSARGHEK